MCIYSGCEQPDSTLHPAPYTLHPTSQLWSTEVQATNRSQTSNLSLTRNFVARTEVEATNKAVARLENEVQRLDSKAKAQVCSLSLSKPKTYTLHPKP